jgi:hypothetical protein
MVELRNRKTGCENGTYRKHQTLSEPFIGNLQDFFLFLLVQCSNIRLIGIPDIWVEMDC